MPAPGWGGKDPFTAPIRQSPPSTVRGFGCQPGTPDVPIRATCPLGGGGRPQFVFLAAAPAPPFARDVLEHPGTRIGPYVLLESIGEGGFGRVYLAEQREPVARRVALKIVKVGMDTHQVVTRFEHERQALAMMEHSAHLRLPADGPSRPPASDDDLHKSWQSARQCGASPDPRSLRTEPPLAMAPQRMRVLLPFVTCAALAAQQWIPHTLPAVPSAATVSLLDVDGTSPHDVWVVGSYTVNHPGYSVQNMLVMHFDGVAWNIVPAPNPIGPGGPQNAYTAVKAFAPDDVWVAGNWYTLSPSWMPTSDLFVAHWDGSNWTPMVTTAASPNGTGHNIRDIVASGPDDIWFLGTVVTGNVQALALHWDGTGFQFHYGPNPPATPGFNRTFRSGAVIAADDAWFVGGALNYLGTSSYLVHYDGSAMSIVPGATSGNTYSMRSVAALASNDVWVLGEEQIGSSLNVLLWRWNGASWNQAPQWQPGFHAHTLHSTGGELLAGGLGGVQRWDGSTWRSETQLVGYVMPVVQVMGNAGSSVFAIGGANGVPSTPFLIERIRGSTVRTPCVGIAPPDSMVATDLPRLGGSWSVAIGDPSNAAQLQPGQTLSLWMASLLPAPGYPCGALVNLAGYGGVAAELLVDPSPAVATLIDSPKVWNGTTMPTTHSVQVPVLPALVGMPLYTQGALIEVGPTALRLVLCNAIDFVVGS